MAVHLRFGGEMPSRRARLLAKKLRLKNQQHEGTGLPNGFNPHGRRSCSRAGAFETSGKSVGRPSPGYGFPRALLLAR